jgi:hypothetical protein
MDFRDATSADLPAPRDDEPTGLRQDILDELADHLACSYNRELLRGAGPGEARRRAIERFGDPAAVARRLWLDAMRGKIMAQRVLIATCVLVMAACFGIVGLVWSQSSRSAAEAAEANRQLAEQLGQTQATNQEMLRQLQAMAKVSQSKASDWIPVKFKLTVEKPDGPPAAEYYLRLGPGQGGAKNTLIHRRSDASGLVDFGVVQPGDWEYLIDAGEWKANGTFNVVPGLPVFKEIVCPKVPWDRAQVMVRVDWPGSLVDWPLLAIAEFRQKSEMYPPSLVWSTNHSFRVICWPGGRSSIIDGFPELIARQPSLEEQTSGKFNDPLIDERIAEGRIHSLLGFVPSIPEKAPLQVAAGHYALDRLMLCRPRFDFKTEQKGEWELLSLMNQSQQAGLSVQVVNHPVRSVIGRRMKPSSPGQFDHFEARPGQPAEWVISLPEEMIREAEKRLKPGAAPEKAG